MLIADLARQLRGTYSPNKNNYSKIQFAATSNNIKAHHCAALRVSFH